MPGWGSRDQARDTQAGPAGRGSGGEGARFPSRQPHEAWELPPDFEFESRGERGRGGVGTHLQRPPPDLASPGWGKQAGTPVRSQPRGLWVPLQWKRCRGALGRGHPLGKETPEEQPGHRGAWEAPNSEESPRGKALNFQERVFPLKKKF